jgi:hypothetical protein
LTNPGVRPHDDEIRERLSLDRFTQDRQRRRRIKRIGMTVRVSIIEVRVFELLTLVAAS